MDLTVHQNLLLEVLSSTATKREARPYLSRFSLPRPGPLNQCKVKEKVEVNRENIHHSPRNVDQNLILTPMSSKDHFVPADAAPLHVALVKIRAPQELDDATILGVGHTLSQLALLGLNCVVIVDCNDGEGRDSGGDRHRAIEQVGRVVGAIDSFGGRGARRVDNVFELSPVNQDCSPSIGARGGLRIVHRKFLLASLQRGVIPVIVPIGFMSNVQTVVSVDANEALLALSREFAGISAEPLLDESPHMIADKIKQLQAEISLDRIILLDPLGGIPSLNGHFDSHLFVNLEQEYFEIQDELYKLKMNPERTRTFQTVNRDSLKVFPNGKVIDQLSNENYETKFTHERSPSLTITASRAQTHIENLKLLRKSLALLPPSASALLTTAEEAANVEAQARQHAQIPGVRTRRQRNPLIYNLLTDKPVFSSSLPSARSRKPFAANLNTNYVPSPATFIKRGMSVTIIPDPSVHPWHPSIQSASSVQLLDARLDLARLVHLIEDSFGRQLNIPHYISRIGNSLAGIVIAGEYEGGALLTWETPPHKSPILAKKVPYLDKFAVLKRSQGAGGVADIVFNAMVRNCFPGGVCWRSRTDNPVNKWYFERAKGSWKIPGSNWTMFWTTDQVEEGNDTFLDYAAVCRSVVPSWSDQKGVLD